MTTMIIDYFTVLFLSCRPFHPVRPMRILGSPDHKPTLPRWFKHVNYDKSRGEISKNSRSRFLVFDPLLPNLCNLFFPGILMLTILQGWLCYSAFPTSVPEPGKTAPVASRSPLSVSPASRWRLRVLHHVQPGSTISPCDLGSLLGSQFESIQFQEKVNIQLGSLCGLACFSRLVTSKLL